MSEPTISLSQLKKKLEGKKRNHETQMNIYGNYYNNSNSSVGKEHIRSVIEKLDYGFACEMSVLIEIINYLEQEIE